MAIRPARLDELDRLIELGEMLHKESSYASMRFSPEKARAKIAECITTGFCVVFEREGQAQGYMGGTVAAPWFSDDLMGVEYSLYVAPQYRGGRETIRMIAAWAHWCEGEGAVQLRPGITTGNMAAIRLYERMGFKVQGVTLCKEC